MRPLSSLAPLIRLALAVALLLPGLTPPAALAAGPAAPAALTPPEGGVSDDIAISRRGVGVAPNAVAPGATAFTRRIDAGFTGASTTSTRTINGQPWFSQSNCFDTTIGSNSTPLSSATVADIPNTNDDQMYRDARRTNSGTPIACNLAVANGSYLVTLHFIETSPTFVAGQRRFHVDIEGARQLTNFDIFVAGGNQRYVPVVRRLLATVTDGQLNIVFTRVTDNAQVAGIEITNDTAAPTATAAAANGGSVFLDQTLPITGTASDPDGGLLSLSAQQGLSFAWSVVSGPAGSSITSASGVVTGTTSITRSASFQPAAKGDYVLRFTATDPLGVPASADVSVTVPNRSPVASAGNDRSAEVGEVVTLSSAASSDPDNDPLSYSWRQLSGPEEVSISNPTSASPSFSGSQKGVYTFEVTASDGDTGTSTDTVAITLNNRAPNADAGADQEADVGQTVTLSGGASSDPDGDPLSYAWQLTSGPAAVTLSDAAAAAPSFTAAKKGRYTFTLTVFDSEGLSDTDTVDVVVRNQAPAADAGSDRTAQVGQSVALSGAASSDPDGDALTYGWTQTAGPPVALDNPTAAGPTFTAPPVPSSLTFTLTVTDSEGLTSSDSVAVTVVDIPIAGLQAASNAPVVLGRTVSVTASITSGSNAVYTWDFGDGKGSATGQTASYLYESAGSFLVTVTATNAAGSTSVKILVTVTNERPVVDAGPAQTVKVSQPVQLGATASDPDGHLPLTYSWTQLSGPAVTLAGADGLTPSFTAPASPAVLRFQLVATDARGLTSIADTVLVNVEDVAPGEVLVTNDGPTIVGQPTSLSASAPGSNLTYSWALGDGQSATGATVQHTYAAEGAYVAEVTVRNGTETERLGATVVVVTNRAPTVVVNDISVAAGATGTFDAGASSDPDGHSPLSFAWQQVGGTPVTLSGATTARPSFSAPNATGTLTFRVTVSDPYGKSTARIVRAQVGFRPIVGLGVATSAPTTLGLTTRFTATIASGTDVVFTWNFGDGNTAVGADVEHVYEAEGSYAVTVTAANGAGTTSATITVQVTNLAPLANAGPDLIVITGRSVTLLASASDPDGHTPLRYAWQQLSGTPVSLSSGSSIQPTFEAPSAATNLVFQLTVTDNFGKSTSDTVTITVVEPQNAPVYRLAIPLVR